MKYKLKVEHEFRDKNTGKLHNVGKTITVSKDRGDELLSHPQNIVSLIEQVAEKGDKKTSDDKPSDEGNPENDSTQDESESAEGESSK